MKLELVLVRHGETEANKSHTIQGHMDTHLSELGLKQVEKLGDFMVNETFHLAISSDLKRAKNTGEAIVSRNSSVDNLELLQVLRERSFGDMENAPVENMLNAMKGKSKEELFNWGPPNGETGKMFRARVQDFVKVLWEKSRQLSVAEPIVLATTHGGFIRDFNLLLTDQFDCQMPSRQGQCNYTGICPNTGVSRYRLSYSETGELETAVCSQLYVKDHLKDINVSEPVLYGV